MAVKPSVVLPTTIWRTSGYGMLAEGATLNCSQSLPLKLAYAAGGMKLSGGGLDTLVTFQPLE